MGNKILLVGLGRVGTSVLEHLSCLEGIEKIVAIARKEEIGKGKVFCVNELANFLEFHPKIDFIKCDLTDMNKTSELIDQVNPDIVTICASTFSWWVIHELEKEKFERLEEVGFGPWLPNHAALPYKLMQAIEKAGLLNTIPVVNASFPDAVIPMLAKVNLAPTAGLGNIQLLAGGLRVLVAKKLNVSTKDVTVFMVGHHCLLTLPGLWGEVRGIPYYVKILVGDKDLTSQFDTDSLIVETIRFQVPLQDPITASSQIKNTLAILNDTGELTHAPGAEGLPGGYPARLNAKGAKIVLPEGISREKAIKINEDAQKFDGIEKIESGGTVILTDKAANGFKELLGYYSKEIRLDECDKKAREIAMAYERFRKG